MNFLRFGTSTRFCVSVLLSFLLSLTSCSAKTDIRKTIHFTPVDSIMKSELGDSISEIILGAKRIKMERTLSRNDSLLIIGSKKLKCSERSIAKFLFAIDENFNDSTVVFTQFSPSIKISFKKSKKQICTAYIDYGIKQVIIKDENEKVLKSFAIKDDRYIKFANLIFPDDSFLTFMLKQK